MATPRPNMSFLWGSNALCLKMCYCQVKRRGRWEKNVWGSVFTFIFLVASPFSFFPGRSAQRRDLPYLPRLSSPLWRQWEDGGMQKEREAERMKGKQLVPLNWCSSYRDMIRDMVSDSAIKELLGNNYILGFVGTRGCACVEGVWCV